jgi:hypothetical protein
VPKANVKKVPMQLPRAIIGSSTARQLVGRAQLRFSRHHEDSACGAARSMSFMGEEAIMGSWVFWLALE